MRFCYYKLVNDLCASLVEAVSYIFNSGDTSLWPVCIEAVDTIEKTLSVNRDSILSESIFDKCVSLKENITLCQKGEDKGQKLIDNITALIPECKTGLRYRFRVLFVAELGGKWDSMASVYDAFKMRDDCDIDVVIEPIFRQQTGPDGVTRTETICDDFLTPMGIKNIPYKDYDIEKIAPDITFISQPYESVTIPMFWPENIAKVSRLVYLPYYYATSLESHNSPAYEAFFKLNVQKYAWKIACQSEKMKSFYELYASEEGRNVLTTGIPKWDYPMKLNKKNTPCPKKWADKLSGKTVFLWNTHFNNKNQGIKVPEQGMEMLNIFCHNNKIALIWRPHPMNEVILKVYYPDKLPLYKKMMKAASDSDNIVVDKNPTYDSAFVWSDALITDKSSIGDLYLLMDKPIIYTSNKNRILTKMKCFENTDLFDYSKINWAYDLSDIKNFIENVSSGKDDYKDNRHYLLDKYLSLADGRCGDRLAKKLIECIEDN